MKSALILGLEEAAEKLSKPDVVDWIEKEFYIPETRNDPILRGRMVLQPYQKDVLHEALSKDENGLYKYSIIVWSDIKKSAKSTIAAAVNLWGTEFSEFGERYIVANDLNQANSRVNEYIRRAISLNTKFRNSYSKRGYQITAPNGSYILAIPIDPGGEAGSNADMITFSELWGANQIAQLRMWGEMTLSPTKHGRSFRWVESYAGFTEESELLYSLYEMGVKQGELLWPDRLYDVTESEPAPLELYVNREARMLCLWNTKPRCPWQTKEYYASEAHSLTPGDFNRMHRNQWVSSSETFVPMEWWYACKREGGDYPKIDTTRQPMVIALDAGISSDTFGLWMGCRHPERKDEVVTWLAHYWKPPKGGEGKIDFVGTEENPGPEMMVRQLIKNYNVVQVCYDPYQLHDMATRLKQEHIAWFYAFGQQTGRLVADSQFRDLIRDRRFWHRGEANLTEHIQNANAEIDKGDRKIRLVKRVENLKIDAAVCASMGSYQLLRLNLG